jgi:hypothetical protein
MLTISVIRTTDSVIDVKKRAIRAPADRGRGPAVLAAGYQTDVQESRREGEDVDDRQLTLG